MNRREFITLLGGAAIGIRLARAVAHQAAGLGVLARHVDCGKPVAGHQGDNLATMAVEEGTAADRQRAGPRLQDRRESGIEFAFTGGFDDHDLRADGTLRLLHAPQLGRGSGSVRVEQHRDDGGLGNELMQQPQPLGRQVSGGKDHPRDVAAGAVEARDQTGADRIGAGHEDDRRRRGFSLSCLRRCGVRDDHGHLPAN